MSILVVYSCENWSVFFWAHHGTYQPIKNDTYFSIVFDVLLRKEENGVISGEDHNYGSHCCKKQTCLIQKLCVCGGVLRDLKDSKRKRGRN